MRTTLSIPDEFYHQIDASYRQLGYTTVNDFILGCIRNKFKGVYVSKNTVKIKSEPYTPIPAPYNEKPQAIQTMEHQIDVTKEIVEEKTEPQLPKCDFRLCTRKSIGHYKIITNNGEEEEIKWLCAFHEGIAHRDGEVRGL